MTRTIAMLGLLCALGLSTNAFARNLTVDEKLSDLDQLASLMKSGYGPLHYKAETLGLTVDGLRAAYADKVRASKTNGEFYYLINQFVAEFQDSHFGASVPTDHAASLPFATELVEGKVLIDTIVRDKLSVADFPFEKGDEIVEFDGQPVGQVLDGLQIYLGSGFKQTARRRAAQALTLRPGARMPVPTGSVLMKIRRGTSDLIGSATLKWTVTGTPVDEFDGTKAAKVASARNFDELSIADLWTDFQGPQFERSYRCSPTTRIAIPEGATLIMMKPFVAYYHPTAKGNVGYLRIPHYSPVNDQTQADESKLRFAQYEYAVSVLEKNTVGLIIDQDHNCGGSVEWLHEIMSLFMPAPFAPMQFNLLANKEEYLQFKKWADAADEHTLEHVDLMATLGLVKAAWDAGDFMTPKTSLDGNALVQPNAIRYSKPIVMLIDEMSGSGGDAFPSLMGGYGRAKLLGTRTMGAGGHVVEQPALFNSQIGLRMTKSLFFRPDGAAVENNGAVPHYPYTITRDDFVYEYRDYQAFYLSKLAEVLQ